MENLDVKKLLNKYEDVYKPSPFREELGVTKIRNTVSQILVKDTNLFQVIVFSEGLITGKTTVRVFNKDNQLVEKEIQDEEVVGIKKYTKYFDNIEDALRCKTELRIDDTWKEDFTIDSIDFLDNEEEYEDLDIDEKGIVFGLGFESWEQYYLQYDIINSL